MATRILATRMWSTSAAASSLRRQPARSWFVDTIHSQAQHRSTKSAAGDESLCEQLYKIDMTLRERKVVVDNLHAEMKSVAKRCVVAIVGLPLLAWVLKTY
ncbi:unnamed protein product [Urochloa humidicola]